MNSKVAQIAVAIMIAALLHRFFLLPALLVIIDGKKGEELTNTQSNFKQ